LVDIPEGIILLGVPPMQQRKNRPDSFKKDAVRRLMARGSKTVSEIAKELGVSPSMLHRWREQFEPEASGTTPVSQGEREEVERLRRELRDLQAENSLLKKAAALFAKDVK
jgi:transposase